MPDSYTIEVPHLGPLEVEYDTRRGPVSGLKRIVGPPGIQYRTIEIFCHPFSGLPGIISPLMKYAGGLSAALVTIPPIGDLALLHPTDIDTTTMLNIQLVQGDNKK